MSASAFTLRPSAAGTWVHCTGSVRMAAAFPEDDGPDAREGVAAHWAATEPLLGRGVNAGDVAPNGITITDEMIEGAGLYQAAVLQRIPAANLHIEQTLAAPAIHEQNGGTSDTWGMGYEAHVLHVVDYKYGHGFVEVFENWQCIDYVSAVWSFLIREGYFADTAEPHITVEITIVQPRNYHRDGPVRTWRVRLDQLRAHFNLLHDKAEIALSDQATTVVGEHCKHCTARHACDALQRAALSACDVAGQATPFALTPAQTGGELRRLQYAAKLLEARQSGLEVQALSMLRSGQRVPYFSAEQTEGRAVWKEGVGPQVLALGQCFGKDLARPIEPITPTQAAKLIDAEVIKQYSFRPRGETKLVPQDTTTTRKIFGGTTS